MGDMITLLTDFGLSDPYVASMKGVILSINPNAKIIDISHLVPRHDVFYGALLLWSTYKYFPKSTIHVVVVDPGVGTKRKAIIIKSKNYYFVGPDNGVLTLAAFDDCIEEVFVIKKDSRFIADRVSHTFHGRDIFAPIAAYLSNGVKVEELGLKIDVDDIVRIKMPEYRVLDNKVLGEVIYIDNFGNLVTSISSDIVDDGLLKYGVKYKIRIKGKVITAPLVKAYGEVGKDMPLIIPDSFGLIEISINLGSAKERLGVSVKDKVEIYL